MQRTTVVLECDLHGKEEPRISTVSFGLDGTSYEMELCGRARARLEKVMQEYIPHARRVSGRTPRRHTRVTRQQMGEVRAWLAEHGYRPSPRGRISREHMEAYQRAHAA
jgi:hypothetical protein